MIAAKENNKKQKPVGESLTDVMNAEELQIIHTNVSCRDKETIRVNNENNKCKKETRMHNTKKYESRHIKAIIAGFAVVCLVLLVVIVVMSGDDNEMSSESKYSGKPVTKYSDNCAIGTSVYVDIVSISPQVGVYEEGNYNKYSHYICKCNTSTNIAVWVYVSEAEFKSLCDVEAPEAFMQEIVRFDATKRVYGSVIKVDSTAEGVVDAKVMIDYR